MLKKIATLVFGLLIANSLYAQDKLVFAIDLIRHGDRTPIQALPKSPYNWTEGLGQLTAIGMNQEYELGRKMHVEYINHYKLLPESYQLGTIYVRSTDLDRTLMSADCFLLGLYSLGTGPKLGYGSVALPGAYQPIPIHTVASSQDNLFFPLSAKQKQAILQQYVFNSPAWQQKNAELQPYYAKWGKATGIKITNPDQVIMLGDTLYVRQLHHIPPPSGLSQQDIQMIINTNLWGMAVLYGSPQMGQAMAHNLLMSIDQYLVQASENQSPLKYVLYSAHDTNILGLMSELGVPRGQQVPYASDLNFLLFKTEQGQYYVKLSFNGAPLKLPVCTSLDCPLAKFTAIDK
ncbi:MAG: hypothetical protein K0R66_61 [Gammaproteobacteria bacterium]|jgi:acid phosphatase|nr:hypothetical protein [Gammaproteobacteria bacterium]